MADLINVRTSKLAILSVVFGILPIGFLCVDAYRRMEDIETPLGDAFFYLIVLAFFAPFVAVILAYVARRRIFKRPAEISGLRVATTGGLLGYAGIGLWLCVPIVPSHGYHLPVADDENFAISFLLSIDKAFQECVKAKSEGQLPETLQQLQQKAKPIDPYRINDRIAEGVYGDYKYTYRLRSTHNDGKLDGFEAVAEPYMKHPQGRRLFYIDETGVIRAESNQIPTEKSPPIAIPPDAQLIR